MYVVHVSFVLQEEPFPHAIIGKKDFFAKINIYRYLFVEKYEIEPFGEFVRRGGLFRRRRKGDICIGKQTEIRIDMKRMLFAAALLLGGGCASSGTSSAPSGPLSVGTLVVEPRADMDAGRYVGVIEETEAAALSFPTSGTILRMSAEEGGRVRRGDLIAELDPTSARQTFEATEAALGQARDACARLRQLHDANSLPEVQWIEAQTRLRQAEAAFGIARKNLDNCKLYAPFSGVVGTKRAAVGETAMPGVPVVTLLEIGSVKVRFSVPEQEIAAISADSRVTLRVPALGDSLFTAGPVEKGAVANPAAHTYDVRAVLPNPGAKLLPGMVCHVTVVPAGAVEEIAVPVRAVQQAGDGSRFVWCVEGDSVVRAEVRTGRFVGNEVVIESGLRAGERIVTDGMQKIGQGSKVSLR